MVNNHTENYMLVPLKEDYLKELYLWNIMEENFELFTCRPLGRIKLFDYNPRNHSAEFGYYFPETNRGKGFGNIMVKKFLKLIFEDTELCLNKLYATTCSNNLLSIKLLEKHGFKLDGRLREHYWIGDKKYDQCVYSILKNELI